MNHPPATPIADPIACRMRENCARVAAFALRTGLFGPLFLLLTALLLRVFGHTDVEFTWQGDTLIITGRKAPEPAAERPARTPSAPQRPDSAQTPADTPSRITRRPVERPPKSAQKPAKPAPRTRAENVT